MSEEVKYDIKGKLTELQYKVTQEADTEPAFTGEYYQHLFQSDHKYKKNSGWPAFHDNSGNVTEVPVPNSGVKRMEVVCSNCKAHLGHVSKDNSSPSGIRYCVNSASLNFSEN
uniref:peptide-methionine (R)-S-oxide reductase n=1 Tax=Euplotes nobilii TaxID=184062 RepID=A0A1Q1NIG3_EUPNO|nr:methionine sulfoxide reductase B [Euplotes nobilii]